jgi:molecular chaperone GrpE (heat shock protein)
LIDQLKGKSAAQRGASAADQKNGDASAPSSNNQEVLDRIDHLEHQLTDMNDRLRRIEASLPGGKSD